MFVADSQTMWSTRLTTQRDEVTVIAGNGTAGLQRRRRASHGRRAGRPQRPGVGQLGETSSSPTANNNVIREVNLTSGVITTYAGSIQRRRGGYAGDGGPATAARTVLSQTGIALDTLG